MMPGKLGAAFARSAIVPAAALLLAALAIAGCASKPVFRTGNLGSSSPRSEPRVPEPPPIPSGPFEITLSAAADTWIGVPYRYGGTSRNGVDCSSLAVHLLEEVGVSLPRSVSEQRDVGRRVERGEVEAGDLVFFRLQSSHVNHVGVALDDARFVHASRSRGVAIDRLDDQYFGKRVAEARRVVERAPESDLETEVQFP
jgi:cell wall-associated NlpC family hydrolase